MNDPYLEKVLRLADVVSPVEQPRDTDWEALERDLGTGLPEDVKLLITNLGSGYFGEFSLLNPCSSSKYACLSRERLLLYHQNLQPIAREGGFSLYPDSDGLIRVGAGSNRMDLLLQPTSSHPVGYRLAWLDQDDRIPKWVDLTVARFLHDLYLGLLSQPWAKEIKDLIWGPDDPFFVSRPGRGEAPPHT
jgi:hypothetical protein